MRLPLLFSCLALAACSKAPVDDSFSDLSALDQKSDAFSYRMKILGALAFGDSQTVKYTKTPRYRAFTLSANADDNVSAWVRSSQGDAVAWLLDASFNVVAFNDDADSTTSDSHLVAHLGAAGTYYIVFRDYALATHYFTVSLDPTGCSAVYTPGGTHDDSVAGLETLIDGYSYSYQLYDGAVPACLSFADAGVRAQVAKAVNANVGFDWQDATPATVGPVSIGASAFVQALQAARGDLDNHVKAVPPTSSTIKALLPSEGEFVTAVIGDSQTNPTAFFEFDLHVEAAECSQDAHARVDTRTGQVLLVRIHGC